MAVSALGVAGLSTLLSSSEGSLRHNTAVLMVISIWVRTALLKGNLDRAANVIILLVSVMSAPLAFIRDILICEDHQLVQLGLEVSLKEFLPKLQSIRVSALGHEALSLAQERKPDLVLLDLGLPDMSGIELIQKLKLTWPDIKILVITNCDSASTLLQAKKLGVSGIMQKGASVEQLGFALRSLDAFSMYLDPVVQSLLQQWDCVDFTPREYEILQEIVQGRSNQEIADKLECATSTVRFHRANILQKANIRTGAELAAWFLRGKRQNN